jgi:hypothetical protein
MIPADWLLSLRSKDLESKSKNRDAGSGRSQETHKQHTYAAYVFPPPSQSKKISLGTEQRIAAIIEREIPETPGTRHNSLLRLSAAFNRLPELRGRPAEFFKQHIYRSWELSKDGGNVAADWTETWADWVRLWDKSQNHDYSTPAEAALAMAKITPFPAIAAKYGTPKMKLLVALCYAMQETCADENDVWYLSCRTAGDLLEVHYAWAWKCIYRLRCDGVIEQVDVPGAKERDAYTYRLAK